MSATGGIDLRLLGSVRVVRDGVELPLGSARRTAVLCVLALHAGHAVSREELVAAVWGADAPASATGNIYTYVSTLRAAGHPITSGGGAYQLRIAPESVDVVRFESLREAARCHRAGGDVAAELSALEAALKLWHGDALAGVTGPFAEAQRLRLAELRLATAERHATLLTETGRPEEAARVLRELVDAYPGRENVRGMLADVLMAGRLGAGPAAAPADPGALIGRATEVSGLRRAAAEAARGNGRSIRIEGTPGIGKSALLGAALRDAVPPGCRVGWAAGDEFSRRTPLGVLLECAESAMSGDPAGGLVQQLLVIAAEALDQPADRTAAKAARLIRGAAEEAPLILVADDLQWADPITLRVWAALGAHPAGLPLLLVAAARSGSPAVRGLPADEIIELTPLDAGAATALVRAVAAEPPEDRLRDRILDDAGGNPHYLRHLAANEPGAPAAEHLAEFTDQTRLVLRAVAVAGAYDLAVPGGRPVGCTLAELAAVTGRTPVDLARSLNPALAAGVLTADGDRLVFRHRIVARTLHEGTPAALRITLHRSFAERIAATGGPAEQVAAQLLAGDVPLDGSAGDWLAEHVEQLAERSPRIAIDVLQRARAQHGLDPARRLSLTASLARLLLAQDRNAATEAGWVAARTGDPGLEGEMRWVAAHSHERRGEFEAAASVARAALRTQRIAAPWPDRLRALLTRVRPHLAGDPTLPHFSLKA